MEIDKERINSLIQDIFALYEKKIELQSVIMKNLEKENNKLEEIIDSQNKTIDELKFKLSKR